MRYEVKYTDNALADLKLLKRNEPASYTKALKLIAELYDHPQTGTRHPEPLKAGRSGQWSRRITNKHRFVYKIEDEVLTVLVLMTASHYAAK